MDWQTILGQVKEVFVALAVVWVPVILGYVFALLKEWVARIKDERLRQLLEELVEAAEQIYGPKAGPAKLRYVREKLNQYGLKSVTRDRIEAAVYRNVSSWAGFPEREPEAEAEAD